MKIYKTRSFSRWASNAGLPDSSLLQAALEVSNGQVEANLGANLYKKRIALPGKGKSGGSRTLVAYQSKHHIFYLYGFEKNEKSNISPKELKALKASAGKWLTLTSKLLKEALDASALIEVIEKRK